MDTSYVRASIPPIAGGLLAGVVAFGGISMVNEQIREGREPAQHTAPVPSQQSYSLSERRKRPYPGDRNSGSGSTAGLGTRAKSSLDTTCSQTAATMQAHSHHKDSAENSGPEIYKPSRITVEQVIDAAARVRDETGVSARLLYAIVMAESEQWMLDGKPVKSRDEQGFRNRYVMPHFKVKHGKLENNNAYTKFFFDYYGVNPKDNADTYRRKLDEYIDFLSASHTPGQIMGLNLVRLNKKVGCADLYGCINDPEVVLRFMAEYLLEAKKQYRFDPNKSPEKAFCVYNTGTPNGKPCEGYVERGLKYWQKALEDHRLYGMLDIERLDSDAIIAKADKALIDAGWGDIVAGNPILN